MVHRICSNCSRSLSQDCYSDNQWRKGIGNSRCHACVGTNQSQASSLDPSQTARCNNATRASFTGNALDNPFACGAFRWVAKGEYTIGQRAGEACVCKWFKTGGVMEDHFYEKDLAASNKAVDLISKWNSKNLIDKMVKVNLPEIWTFLPGSRSDFTGRKVLQEPFITDYQKFNSNSGWADDSLPWPRVMQALSHFTYHISSGQSVLCDLQGGVYQDGVVLTDPVVMSTSQGTYGPTDLGQNGISTFFYHHTCNEYCRSEWLKPAHRAPYFSRTANTTMEHVPTHASRHPMTKIRGPLYK